MFNLKHKMSTSTLSSSSTYNELVNAIKQHLEIGSEAHLAIQKFKKLIQDHLDPSCKDIDLENTPIYLDEIDHHLHPQIQEILTDNFALRQKQHQVFETIHEYIFKLSSEYPEMSQSDFQIKLKENKLPLYLIPVVPSHTVSNLELDYAKLSEQKFIWGNKEQKYQMSIILTPNKKFLKEGLLKYGFDSLEDIEPYLNMSGFISI
jgi:hypothetical protein